MSEITTDEIFELLKEDDVSVEELTSTVSKDSAFEGLQIISKYIERVLQGADHDIVYSADYDHLIEAGITREDVMKLRRLGWFIKDDAYLACSV